LPDHHITPGRLLGVVPASLAETAGEAEMVTMVLEEVVVFVRRVSHGEGRSDSLADIM